MDSLGVCWWHSGGRGYPYATLQLDPWCSPKWGVWRISTGGGVTVRGDSPRSQQGAPRKPLSTAAATEHAASETEVPRCSVAYNCGVIVVHMCRCTPRTDQQT